MNNLKKEFYEKFCEAHDGGIDAGEYYSVCDFDERGTKVLWSWIESKLKEETDKAYKKGFIDSKLTDKRNIVFPEGNLVDKVSKKKEVEKIKIAEPLDLDMRLICDKLDELSDRLNILVKEYNEHTSS